MNKYLTIILLLLISHCAISQEMKYHIIPTNYPIGARLSCSVISNENGSEWQRFFLFNDVKRNKYYVFDSYNITFEEAYITSDFHYIGFSGNVLIGYCEKNDSLSFIDYSTKQTIQLNSYSNNFVRILKYVGKKGLSTSNIRFSISKNGVLAFVDQGKSVLTFVEYNSDTLSRIDIPIHYDHGLFQWVDTNNLYIANANVIDDHGSMMFNVTTYNYNTKSLLSSKFFSESIFYHFDKGYLFKKGEKLMVGEDFSKPAIILTLPADILYIYEAIPLSENRFLISAERNKLGSSPFIIMEVDKF